VNRLLTEGRRAFLRRVSGIQRGADCARYEPMLSALADGEASADDLALLRPHMRTCLSCRAALREFRATPERVASVVPPAALAVSDGGPLRNLFESLLGAAQHKTAVLGERVQAAAELATGQKLAVVAASAAALAGGGTAAHQYANHHGPPLAAQVRAADAEQAPDPIAETPPPSTPPAEAPAVQDPLEPAPAPAAPPPPDPAAEFTVEGAQAAPASADAGTQSGRSAKASGPAGAPPGGSPSGSGAPSGGGSSGAGSAEFGP
jgi:uncharacterized membrane protein YgcG